MKKIFSMLCAGSLVVLATACGGNKAAENDSDSIIGLEADTVVAIDSVAPDTTIVTEVVEETAEVVDNTAAKAENVAKKAATTATKAAKTEANKVKDAATKTVEKATDKASSAVDRAISRTQEVAEKGVDDAAAKAKAWKDKKKKSE